MNRLFMLLALFSFMGCNLEAAPDPEISQRIVLLADPSFAARQKAAADLRELGMKHREEVEKALIDAYRHSGDPEVQFRSREILTELFASSLGYIGIKYAKREHITSQGEKRWVILINDVQIDSPASKAKLLTGDVILRLNGEVLDAEADTKFPLKIKSIGSGSVVNLLIERNGEEKRVPVTLGIWPRPLSVSEADALFLSKIRSLEPKPIH